MEIEYTQGAPAKVRYDTLKPGDVFRANGDPPCLVTNRIAHGDLLAFFFDGEQWPASAGDLVTPVKAKIVVEGPEEAP